MVSLVFFDILQQPHTVISNSKKLTHPKQQPVRLFALDRERTLIELDKLDTVGIRMGLTNLFFCCIRYTQAKN